MVESKGGRVRTIILLIPIKETLFITRQPKDKDIKKDITMMGVLLGSSSSLRQRMTNDRNQDW